MYCIFIYFFIYKYERKIYLSNIIYILRATTYYIIHASIYVYIIHIYVKRLTT